MKYRKFGERYVVQIEQGKEIIANLKRFVKKEDMRLGSIIAIGAAKNPTLRFFDPEKKKYSDKTLEGHFEIINFTGNISEMKGDVYLHCHMTLGDTKFKSFGGHVLSAEVGGTFEAIVTPLKGRLGRKYSKEVGLNLYEF
jgi:predicted DNA-binding protein with PD1-like motif